MNPLYYEARTVDFHGVMEVSDHRLKIYSLRAPQFADDPLPPAQNIERMLEAGILELALEADHKVGFAILHWAGDGLYVLVNTWYDANMLRLSAFRVDDLSVPEPQLESLAHLHVIACVWELEIYKFERDAWVREVLEQCPPALTNDVLAGYFEAGMRGTA
ncbi:hypothetical protein [Saliniramus fredricksonii]|uniref:Uncharacterized protein n=1 Tax=Saliniramus fredricksonii TaxID=1653334 RepID=A0ABY0K3L7_9HYPH|nr:hypothetical protein [Saliniramus fredricksonii]SCC77987.1 hypothetical protein GA0071312_0014 [Saliniramus fredricksonii]